MTGILTSTVRVPNTVGSQSHSERRACSGNDVSRRGANGDEVGFGAGRINKGLVE